MDILMTGGNAFDKAKYDLGDKVKLIHEEYNETGTVVGVFGLHKNTFENEGQIRVAVRDRYYCDFGYDIEWDDGNGPNPWAENELEVA